MAELAKAVIDRAGLDVYLRLVEAIRQGKMFEFLAKVEDGDLLSIDRSTQEENP